MRAARTGWLLCALLTWAVAGCETYADTVSCSNGTVLDENDECVPPPVPDGGVAVETCAELCDLVAGWDATQVECLTTNLAAAGPPPTECMGDLTVVATCNACVTATGAPDSSCATVGALCQ